MKYILLAVFALAALAVTYAETTCQSHKRNSQNSAHGMKWNIECDSEGHYLPLQCTEDRPEKKWCACYNKEEAITSPSRKTRQCDCPLKVDELRNSEDSNACLPRCENTGKYSPAQQCRGQYYCVNQETGERTTEPSSNSNLQCN